ncbi:MAG: hypothetical protein ACRYG2_37760, partial [Janthinobacterium lividum]
PIGGLTPAADMADLLGLGGKKARVAAPAADVQAKTPVKLSTATRRAVGARARVAVPSSSLEPLPSPFAVSGVGGSRLKRLQKDADTADLPLRVYAAGRAAAPRAAPTARPVPGGNFASVQSYGDVTAASIGTTTYVCGDQALAFGHPDQFSGPAHYGASDADAVAIVQDSTFGSFKMADLAGSFGTVDQDRLAGIRADLTKVPSGVPIRTTVHDVDTGRSRTGTTQVVDRTLLPGLTPYALWANDDATFDEVGDGRLSEGWTITGTRAGGKSFKVHRNNKWADQEDATFDPAVGLADAVYALGENDDEHVTITSVTYDARISTTFRELRLSKVEVSVDGGKTWSSPSSVRVKAGKKLTVRTTVKPYQATIPTTSVTTLTVPRSAKGEVATLAVTGGSSFGEDDDSDATACLLDESCADTDGASLDKTITGIESAPRNDDLVVALQTDSDDEEADGTKGSTTELASEHVRQAEVVTGSRSLEVEIR